MNSVEKNNYKVVIIGLDGVPYTFIKKLIEKNRLPNFKKLIKNGSMSSLTSILPTVSGVAWTAIFTGNNPANFGIFGFLDVTKDYNAYIPNSTSIKCENILEILSKFNKRIVSIGVPMTFPPKEINGVCVSGFLTPNLEKGVYPKIYLETLNEEGYLIDVNPMKARESLDYFTKELTKAFESRKRTMLRLLKEDIWDFFITHFIDTDRINHFMWNFQFNGDTEFKDFFFDFYKKVDDMLGEVMQIISDDTILIVLSDHGFCTSKKNIEINYWLQKHGYLKLKTKNPRSFQDIDLSSKAFSLTPGRIYIHTKNWAKGMVTDEECKKIISEIKDNLEKEVDPENNNPIFKQIYTKNDYYNGKFTEMAPEIIILPQNGYDLKAKLNAKSFINSPEIQGMHTFEDAMIIFNKKFKLKEDICIIDILPTILNLLGISYNKPLDGSSIILD
ncbi:MAG: alkaline phosphatase family protein [Promethearchaeota archaeon]